MSRKYISTLNKGYIDRMNCLRDSIVDIFELIGINPIPTEIVNIIDDAIANTIRYDDLLDDISLSIKDRTKKIMYRYFSSIADIEARIIELVPEEYREYIRKNLERYMISIYQMKHHNSVIPFEHSDDVNGKRIVVKYESVMPMLTEEQTKKIVNDFEEIYNMLKGKEFTIKGFSEAIEVLKRNIRNENTEKLISGIFIKREIRNNMFASMNEIEAISLYKMMQDMLADFYGIYALSTHICNNYTDYHIRFTQSNNNINYFRQYLNDKRFYVPLGLSIDTVARNCWRITQTSDKKSINVTYTQAGPYNTKSNGTYDEKMKGAYQSMRQQIEEEITNATLENRKPMICFCNLCGKSDHYVSSDPNISKAYSKYIPILRREYKGKIDIIYFRANINLIRYVWNGEHIEETIDQLIKLYKEKYPDECENDNLIQMLSWIRSGSFNKHTEILRISMMLILCDRLGIRNVINCKEGKDRTGCILAMKLRLNEWLETHDKKLPKEEEWTEFYHGLSKYIDLNNERIREMLPGLNGTHNISTILCKNAKMEYTKYYSDDNGKIDPTVANEHLYKKQHGGFIGKNGNKWQNSIRKRNGIIYTIHILYPTYDGESLKILPMWKLELYLKAIQLSKKIAKIKEKENGNESWHIAKKTLLCKLEKHLELITKTLQNHSSIQRDSRMEHGYMIVEGKKEEQVVNVNEINDKNIYSILSKEISEIDRKNTNSAFYKKYTGFLSSKSNTEKVYNEVRCITESIIGNRIVSSIRQP